MSPQLASTLTRAEYISSDVFETEMACIFSQYWLCIGRSESIAQAGDYFLQTIGEENLIVTRDEEGQPHAFFNVCRHRGTRLCTESEGSLGRSIRCPYHAWTYGLNGRLLGAPHMNEVADFDKAAFPLHEAQIAEWEGFLFINLDATAPPFSAVFAHILQKFTPWQLSRLRRHHRIEYHVQANWKILFQNYSECYHCPGVHPELARLSPYRSGVNDLTEGLVLGGPSLIRQADGSLTMSGQRCSLPVGNVSGTDLQRVYFYTFFPNMFLSLHPDYVMVHLLWPLAPDQTLVFCDWLFDPLAATQAGFHPDDAVAFWDLTNRQDWEVCELTQAGVRSRRYLPGPYSTLETMSLAFEQTYRQAMNGR
ncbi:MAG: aromatic ring-hydroxylating dioxygenase subunit alpha [Chloroflexi bacterium]|nr:MAG: aromatic ring-hydroxylating dioxygenase subunit alpha [Chloroflexota bacterium]